MDSRAKVAWNLRRIRVSKGISQEALALDAGVDRTYVSRLERNRENPSLGVLDRLAAALSVETVTFFCTPDTAEPLPLLKKGRKPLR